MVDWQNILGGAASGAAAGSAFGPGIGTAIGGGLGGLLGLLNGGGSKKDKISQLPMINPQQQQAFSQYWQNPIQNSPLYGAGQDYLMNLLNGNPSAFSAFEAPYMHNFQQNIVPGIAERFAGLGTGSGAGSSSGLYNSLGQAGRNLQTDLAGLRSGLQMQGLPQALGYAQQPYSNILSGIGQRTFENTYQPGSTGFFGPVGSGLGTGLGLGLNPFSGLGGLFGGFGGTSPQAGRPG
jgi:hypothetical protein